MSIKPIDLQTLFVKMDEVSKEQALAKDQAALQQAQAAKAQVTKELQQDHQVTQAPEDREAEVVKDESHRQKSQEGKKNPKNPGNSDEDDAGREVVQDPEVGRHVDLSG